VTQCDGFDVNGDDDNSGNALPESLCTVQFFTFKVEIMKLFFL